MDVTKVEDEIIEETTNKIEKNVLVSTSTVVHKEDLSKERSSPSHLILSDDLITSNHSNRSLALENLNCGLSYSNSNIEENELHLDLVNNDLNMEEEEALHEHCPLLFATKSLNNDDLAKSQLVDNNNFTTLFDVENNIRNLSSCKWIDGTDDLYLSKLNFMVGDNPKICNPSNSLVEIKQTGLNEADLWNDVGFGRNKHQNIEDDFKRLKSTKTSLNGNFHDMDINGEITSNVHDVLELQKLPNMLVDGKISLPSEFLNPYNTRFLNPSNASMKLESLCSSIATDTKLNDFESSLKIYEDGIESKEQVELLKDSLLNPEPCYQDHISIEELPILTMDVKKEVSTTKLTKSGIVIHEESYDIRPLEDDVSYVVVEPLCNESSTSQLHKDTSLQQDMTQQSMEIFPIEMQDTTRELSNGVKLNDDTNDVAIKGQCIIDTLGMHNKIKKSKLKPLFFRGFLIKSSTLSLEKTMNPNGNTIINKEIIQDHYDEGNENLSNGRCSKNPTSIDNENESKKSSRIKKSNNHVISNCNHCNENGSENENDNGNEKLELKKMSKEIPINFGRENDISILMDQSRSMKHLKQGRNDSCACGSQQKWKKCCGKAIVFKGGLATKQVKV